jgi:TldD protein
MNVNRRSFIRTSGAAAAGSIFLSPLLQSWQTIKNSSHVRNYLDHFEVSTETLQKVIAAAMSKGGNYADLYFEHKISGNLGLEDGKVNRAFSNVDFGVGIRVLKGDQTGFAYTETLTLDEMLNAARLAANIANSNHSFAPETIQEKIPAEQKIVFLFSISKILFLKKKNTTGFLPSMTK